MMLVVIASQSGYDDYSSIMLFATPSRVRAEEKLLEFQVQQERQKVAEKEFFDWEANDKWILKYFKTPENKRDYLAFDVRCGAKRIELESKYDLRKKQLLSGHYDFFIDEVESD